MGHESPCFCFYLASNIQRLSRALMNSPAPHIDHTLLKPETCSADIERICEEAVEYSFASVCIPPRFVPLAARMVYGSVCQVGTVVGFPFGYESTSAKVFQTELAVAQGAAEVDMVIPVGAALEGDMQAVASDVEAVVRAAGTVRVKAIIECCYLNERQKIELSRLVADKGVAYVKTSTGFAYGGATLDDVRLLARTVAGRIKVKAAGGIRNWASCRAMLNAGADRVGTSAAVAIMQQWRNEAGL